MPDLHHSVFHRIRALFPADWQPIVCSKATLIDFSHAIEDAFIVHRLRGVLFTGFQESSYWQQEVQRYRHISQIAQQVCIFAGRPLPQDAPYSEVRVTLPDDSPLRQEWFVIGLTEHFSILLAGLDQLAPVEHDALRRFETLWTFDSNVIGDVLAMLLDIVRQQRPDKAEQVEAALRRFPPRPPDAHYASLIVQKFLGHLEQQHLLAHAAIFQLDNLVEERTRQRDAAQRTLARVLQQLTSAVIVLNARAEIVLSNDVGQLLLQGSWDRQGEHLPILHLALAECVQQTAIYQRDLILGDLVLALSSSKLEDENGAPLTVVVLHDLSQLYLFDQTRQALLDMLSHQLRTPLTVLNNTIYLLERDPARLQEHLSALRLSLQRLVALVNNLLEIAEAQLFATGFLPIYVHEVLEHFMTHLGTQPWRERVRIENLLTARLVVQLDLKRLIFCLLDVLDCMQERLPEAANILVRIEMVGTTEPDLWLVLRFIDSGEPLPAEELLRDALRTADEPTQALSAATRRALRLSMARRIIAQYGGLLSAENAPSQTQVSVHLPARRG
jgi:signal transduction histidine kinase/DICT domain-containing protein